MLMRNNDLSKKLSEQTCSNARLEGEKAQLEQTGQKLKEEHVQLQQIVKDMTEMQAAFEAEKVCFAQETAENSKLYSVSRSSKQSSSVGLRLQLIVNET